MPPSAPTYRGVKRHGRSAVMSVRGDHRSWWVPALPPAREAADIRIWHSVFSAAGGYRVALIHGMEGTWASWGPLTRRLRRRYDVLDLMRGNVLRRVEPYGFLQLDALLCGLAALPLHAVRVPVLIVNGPTDPSAPPEAVRTLARRLPAGRLAQRDAFRHFCQLDQAEEVSVLVNGFLDEVLPATGPIPVPAPVPTDGTRFAAVAGRGRSEP